LSEDSHVPQDLLAHRVVKLFGSIGPQTLSQCRDALLHIDSESEAEITLLIDSTGGELIDAFQLYAVIRMLRSPVTAVVLGECSSAALIVLQACTTKRSSRYARFLLHSGPATRPFRVDQDFEGTLRLWLEEKRRIDKEMVNLISECTNMTVTEVEEFRSRGDSANVCFGSEEALRLG
jgi:ATP-dependent protease ClpP protease subunit